jgi:hypothetical protein
MSADIRSRVYGLREISWNGHTPLRNGLIAVACDRCSGVLLWDGSSGLPRCRLSWLDSERSIDFPTFDSKQSANLAATLCGWTVNGDVLICEYCKSSDPGNLTVERTQPVLPAEGIDG